MFKNRPPVVTLACVLLVACAEDAYPPTSPSIEPAVASTAELEMVPDSTWIVLFHRHIVADARGEAEAIVPAHSGNLRNVYPTIGGFSAKLSSAAVEALRRNPKIRVISPNDYVVPYHHQAQQNAPWGLTRIDQRHLPLNSTYDYTADGSDVSIWILDTGTNPHPELSGRLVLHDVFQTGGFDCGDGIGHGTGMASLAAGTTFGVAKEATVHALDALCQATVEEVFTAFDWVLANHQDFDPESSI